MRIKILILLILLPFLSSGQIAFETGSLKAAFTKSIEERKPLFIMVHADGCPHCEHYLETFKTNKAIAAFYNSNFVNFKLEVNSEDGMAFRRDIRLNVLSTPILTFWQADSTLLAIYPSGDEQNNEADILDFARRALDPKANWQGQKPKGCF